MKALVTGSTGFIGSHLVEALLGKDYQVYCLIRETSNLKWIKDLDVEFVAGSYSDKESLCRAVKDMDYVFHVGAVIDALEWETFYRANVESTVNLVEACVKTNPGLKKFVFVSSIAAAGPAVDKKPIKETDECRPVSLYGKSKYLAEQAAARFFDKLPIVILRPTKVPGPRQKQLYSLLKLADKRLIPMLGNGDKQTNICFVQDVVRAIIMAAENNNVRSRTFFIASQEAYSWREMLDAIAEELGLNFVIKIPHGLLMTIAFLAEITARVTGGSPLIKRSSIRSVRKNYWLHDVRRIKEELGFTPEITFAWGMRDTIKWYKDQGLIDIR